MDDNNIDKHPMKGYFLAQQWKQAEKRRCSNLTQKQRVQTVQMRT